MASMNYCLTVCRSVDEKRQPRNAQNSTPAVDIPQLTVRDNGTPFFGRFFSLGSSSPTFASTLGNSSLFNSMSLNDMDENLF